MQIYVNGNGRETAEGSTISDLLQELEIRNDQIAVEVNVKIIDRSEFDSCILKDQDKVEIINFIGGGCNP